MFKRWWNSDAIWLLRVFLPFWWTVLPVNGVIWGGMAYVAIHFLRKYW